MGGRVASMIADELHAAGEIAGLVCLGYPFHPPGKPEQLRTKHLAGLKTPALICQGTRDVFGARDEVSGYTLSDSIELLWLEDGDHDLKPRKGISGFSAADHLKTMAQAVAGFAGRLALMFWTDFGIARVKAWISDTLRSFHSLTRSGIDGPP